MNHKPIKFFAYCLLLVSAAAGLKAQGVIACAADGVTDVTTCLQSALNTIGQSSNRQTYLQAGTYLISQPLVIPNKVQVIGVGRGDPGINTVIKASSTFPTDWALVQLGPAPGPDFDVQISNLTLDGSSRAGACLANLYGEELSWGRNLMLTHCADGLWINGSGAQNSGPFEDLEIYPYGSDPTRTHCATIWSSPGFRGMRDVTCNGGNMGTQPTGGFLLDGGGTYANFHIEHFTTGIVLGNLSAADGMTISGAEFGPSVQTGIQVTNSFASENLTFLGIYGYGMQSLLNDQIMNINITDPSLGFYMIGNGGGNSKPLLSSKWGLGSNFFGNMGVGGNLAVGNGDWHNEMTFSVYDGTPTGITTVLELAGANQGSTDLHQWRDSGNNTITTITAGAGLQTSNFQLLNTYSPPTCSATLRGTMSFVPGSPNNPDHLQVCAKSASNSYVWIPVF